MFSLVSLKDSKQGGNSHKKTKLKVSNHSKFFYRVYLACVKVEDQNKLLWFQKQLEPFLDQKSVPSLNLAAQWPHMVLQQKRISPESSKDIFPLDHHH